MKRALLAVLLLWSASALATEYWQSDENTGGYCTPAVMASACVMVSQLDGEIACLPTGAAFTFLGWDGTQVVFNTVPASSVSGVPTGVLEGLGGAITAFSMTQNFVPYGAAANGGIQQSPNLQFDGTTMWLGAHATAPQATLQSSDLAATFSDLFMYPGSGTNKGSVVRLVPKGTGAASNLKTQEFLYNTDWVADKTNVEALSIAARGSIGYVMSSFWNGTGVSRPITIATDVAGVQLVENTNGSISFGAGDLLMTLTGTQSLTKSGGNMTVGTSSAHTVTLKTSGSNAIVLDTSQLVTLPAYAGGGTQCLQVDNTGKVGVTGAVCGGGGGGGITQLTGDGTAGPGAGSQTFTLHNIPTGTTAPGDIVFTLIAAPSTPAAGFGNVYVDSTSKNLAIKDDGGNVNHGMRDYTCSTHTYATVGSAAGVTTCAQPSFSDVSGSLACAQQPAFAGDLSSAGGTCSVNVTAMQSDALARGDILYTSIAAPSTPGAGSRCYHDSGTGTASCKNSSGVVTHGTITYACGGSQWARAESGSGTVTCSQPAFSDLTGSATCAQLPALTGGVTSSAGSCATTVASVPCAALPTPGTCGTATTYGSSGSYIYSTTVDSKGLTSGVVTSTIPPSGAIVYTMASSSIAMGYNQSTLVMPVPAGPPIVDASSPGTAITTVLAANWGSSSQSPPTYGIGALGSIKCTGDITNYVITGPGAVDLVAAMYYVTTNPFTTSNWHLIGSGTKTLPGGGSNAFNGIGFVASSTTGLVPPNSSIVLVLYRSDAGNASTLTTLNANIVCSLGI